MNTAEVTSDYVRTCIQSFKAVFLHRAKPRRSSNGYDKEDEESFYNIAKQSETKTRNLKKALSFYVQAAKQGEKINSCIKDFASVLHQCGYTHYALCFLQDMKKVYKGDQQKYEKLIQNMSSQLRPTGKHEYKNILIDLIDVKLKEPQSAVVEMFQNHNRIRSIKCYEDVGFEHCSTTGRYIVLRFDSFSAAKKTLDTFKSDEWFGISLYWMDMQLNIVAQASDGKTDFQTGLLIQKGEYCRIQNKVLNQTDLRNITPDFSSVYGLGGLELQNERSLYLLKNYKTQTDTQSDSL